MNLTRPEVWRSGVERDRQTQKERHRETEGKRKKKKKRKKPQKDREIYRQMKAEREEEIQTKMQRGRTFPDLATSYIGLSAKNTLNPQLRTFRLGSKGHRLLWQCLFI